MPSQKPALALDLDDVLKETCAALCRFHNAHFGTNHTPEKMPSFNLDISWDCTSEETARRLDLFFRSEHHTEATPMEGALEALQILAEHYELHIVTARPEVVRNMTAAWVNRHYPRLFTHMHFLSAHHLDHNSRPKSDICRAIGARVFIDDGVHNVKDVFEKLGIVTLIFTQPLNFGWEMPKGMLRVNNWGEILDHLVPN
ncbi:MAG: hypothetical protein WCI89_01520 [bacterium]